MYVFSLRIVRTPPEKDSKKGEKFNDGIGSISLLLRLRMSASGIRRTLQYSTILSLPSSINPPNKKHRFPNLPPSLLSKRPKLPLIAVRIFVVSKVLSVVEYLYTGLHVKSECELLEVES